MGAALLVLKSVARLVAVQLKETVYAVWWVNIRCDDSKKGLGVGEIVLLTIIITFIVVICLFGINHCIRRYIAISKYKTPIGTDRELLLDNDSAVGLISDRGFGENAKDWTIRFDAIKFGDIIGEGSVGKVYKGVYAGENAVKSLIKDQNGTSNSFFTTLEEKRES